MDADRLGQLLDRHGRALGLFARQWCDDAAADDVVQEAFVALSALLALPDRPAAWLFRAVRNAAINAGRAGDRRRRHEAAAGQERDAFLADPSSDDQSGAIDPESARCALDALPADQRQVIVARLWGGLSFGEAAEALGCSSSQAHRLYHAGLESLRERLQLPPVHRPRIPTSRGTHP
jgi:RNA polymerase sigma-70 factor (ECF subfamily)